MALRQNRNGYKNGLANENRLNVIALLAGAMILTSGTAYATPCGTDITVSDGVTFFNTYHKSSQTDTGLSGGGFLFGAPACARPFSPLSSGASTSRLGALSLCGSHPAEKKVHHHFVRTALEGR